jgi:hypothetical protein
MMRDRISPAIFALVISLLTIHTALAADPLDGRVYSVSMTYDREQVYAGRLTNAKAAFAMLQTFLDTDPFGQKRNFSFLKDVLRGSMLPSEGYVMTMFGYGYGACGAPSLLNQLVRTAVFRDSDGVEKPVLEALVWRRENSPTYKGYGVAILLDTRGGRSSDYVWRVNPTYDGPAPQISITLSQTGPETATVTMTMHYADEIAADQLTATPTAGQ